MSRLAALVAALLMAACGGGVVTTLETVPPGDDTTTTTRAPSLLPAVLAPSPGVSRSAADDEAPIDDLVRGFNQAGFRLWAGQPLEDNFVFSPTSIGHALLLARAAADARTGAAIDLAFQLPQGLAAHHAWNAIDQGIGAADMEQEEVTVKIADRIWPAVGVAPDQGWIDLLAAEHGASTETLDLAGDPGGSRRTINDWVSEETQGLIPELMPDGFIRPETVLVLTDALYFKARWEKIFGKYGPVTETFTRLDGTTVEVEFMQELELGDRRGSGDGFVGAEIPYLGGEFSMLVIVPDEGRLGEIRDELGQDLLNVVDASFTTGPFELLLPPWEDQSRLDLSAWLTEIGAAPGHYPGISEGAFLDAAVHAADIAVDKWGTVAGAATGLGFNLSGPPEPELRVAADQPFLYLIRHRASGLVLFAGQVIDPTK